MIPTDFYLAWYDAMIKSVQTSICLKRKKRYMLPFYFSSHSVHLGNKVSTAKRKLAKFNLFYSTLLSDLQRDLNNSIELDKITLLSSFIHLVLTTVSSYFTNFLAAHQFLLLLNWEPHVLLLITPKPICLITFSVTVQKRNVYV